jgi:hypothetical protein
MFFTLSPFAAFAALMVLANSAVALGTAAALSLGLLVLDRARGRSWKALQLVTATMFALLALYVALIDGQLAAHWVRVAIDGSLLALGVGSMLLRAPFTIQYARESVTREIAARPEFRRVNYLLTGVWTAAFATMLVTDLVSGLTPWLPLWSGIVVAFVARNGAAAFTQWYASMRQRLAAVEIARTATASQG